MMQAWRDALFGLERNPFWRAHRDVLSFHVEQMAIAWETANELACDAGEATRMRAFVLRDLSNLLIPAVVSLLHGHARALAVSIEVWRFFPHESYSDWEYKL